MTIASTHRAADLKEFGVTPVPLEIRAAWDDKHWIEWKDRELHVPEIIGSWDIIRRVGKWNYVRRGAKVRFRDEVSVLAYLFELSYESAQ